MGPMSFKCDVHQKNEVQINMNMAVQCCHLLATERKLIMGPNVLSFCASQTDVFQKHEV